VIDTPFQRITYTDAIAELEKSGIAFEFPVKWGMDLQSEHEKHLTEKVYQGPVIVTGYPKEIKAFYMKLNEDNKTVRAMDVLVPRLGEIIGGSEREDRLSVLEKRIADQGLIKEDYWWYLDLRRFGTVPHSGFGLGFERLIQYVTGMQNIRDVIPFPRAVKNAEF
jgi:asparaginyl-tRNA synthetase